MALVIADRVKDTSTTTGTGTMILSGTAPAGYRTFAAAIGNLNTTYYAIVGQTTSEWEVGVGSIDTSVGTTLGRITVLSSSNSGSLVSFSAGTKDVFVTYPAGRAVTGAPGLVENDTTITASYTITTGKNAMSSGPITINTGVTVTVPTGSNWTIV
jgi:hypothetical protein